MRYDFNSSATPVYAPNSFGGPHADAARAGEGYGWESDGELVRAAATLHRDDDDDAALPVRGETMQARAHAVHLARSAARILGPWRAAVDGAAAARDQRARYARQADYYYKTRNALAAWRAGATRSPSAGSPAMEAGRTMIRPPAGLFGSTKLPVNVAPLASAITSPGCAALSAACRSPPAGTAMVRSVPNVAVADWKLDIGFTAKVGAAVVNAIEVEPAQAQ